MAEITVDVGARLHVIQSSVAELQRVLDKLEPNSTGFKNLQKIITSMTSEMDKLKIQTSKPFGSQSQFNQTEKTVDKLEESLERAKIAIDRIKFSDLKLDSSQTAQLENFENQLKTIKQDFLDFKDDLKSQFLADDFNKAFIDSFNPNLVNKNFDEIVKNVSNKTDELGRKAAEAVNKLNDLKQAQETGKKIDAIPNVGLISEKGLGTDVFNRFFQTNTKGVFSFKTGGGLKKGEIQQQFIEYLTGEFQLTENQIKQLQNQTASNIRQIVSNPDFFNFQRSQASYANANIDKTGQESTEASRKYENALATMNRLVPLLQALSIAEEEQAGKIKDVNQAEKEYEQGLAASVRNSQEAQTATTALTGAFSGFKNQLQQTNAQWVALERQQATFNSMKRAIVNFMGFNQVLNITKRAVQEAANHIKQLDTVMNGIAIVTDMTTADLWNQVGAYSEMAQRYGTSIQGAYEVSKIYYQAGYETNDVLTLMNETLKLSKISGLDYATTTDYMMTATRGFHMEVSEASKVVDVYSALAANTAVSQQELAEAMTKTASSMESVGTTFEEASAMIATMVATTRESANNIGSAMKSIASRYGELTKDPTKLFDAEGEAMSFNKVDEALKSVGISLQTTDHQFRSFTDVILELSEVWSTLDSTQQRYIATQFAGNRQQSRFLALVSNPDQIRENLEVAAASEDTGTLQALKALDSLESKLNQVQVAYQQFYTTIGAEGIWKTALDGVKNFVDSLNGLPKVFDKIPLGAVAILGNLIGLVKTALLNGLTTIAQEWNNIMNNTNNNATNMAQNGGDKIGKTWIGALFSAIKEGQPKIEAAMAEAVGSGSQKPQQELKYTGTKINTEDFLFKDYYSKNFNPADTEKAADTYLQTLVNMEQAGTKFSQSTLNQLLDIGAAIEDDGISLREAGQRAIQVIQGTGSAAETNTSKVSNFWQELGKSGSNWQKGLTGLSQSLTTIGMLLDKTSESGRIMSGVMTGLGGAVQTGVAAARVMVQDWSALPQLIMGIFNVINGVGIAWETDAERLERLTKEAEELNNEAKKTKAEYSTLQRSIDKLDELKQKRYDSAEAAEEYQTAVDELADQFPQLITSLDATGNAAIEAASLDYELEKARRASAQATMEAVQAEIDAKKEEINQAKDTNKKQRNNIFDLPSLTRGGSVEGLFTDSDIENLFNSPMKAKNINAESMTSFITAKLDEIYNDAIEKVYDEQTGITSTKYKNAGFTSYFGNDGVWHFKIDNDKNFKTFLQDNNLEQYQEQILALADIDDKVKTSIEEQYARLKTIDLKNLDEDQESKFNDEVDDLIKTISSDTGAMVQYQPLLDVLTSYQKGSLTLAELNQQMTSLDKQLISSKVMSKFPEFYNNLGEFQNVVVNYLNNFEDEANFNKELESIKKQFELLSPSNRDKLLEMWKNKEQYTAQDFKDIVGENTSLFDSINNYYEQVLPDYTKFLQNKMAGQFGNEPQIDNISNLEEAIEGAKDIMSANLQGWLSEVIDLISEYSKQGMTKHAADVAAKATEVLNELNEIKDPFTRAIITNSMKENGISNISSIDSIISDIINIPELNSVRISLENLKNSLIHNLPLAIEAYTDQILTDIDNLEKEIKNISNGMSFSEAYTALEKINAANDTSFTLSDLDTKNGKLYFNNNRNNLQTLYLETITGDLQNTYNEINDQITNIGKEENDVNRQLKNLLNLDNFNPMENIFNKNEYEDLYKLLKDLNYVEDVQDQNGDWTQFKFTEEGILNLIKSGKDPAQVIIDLLTERLGSAASAIEYANKILPAQAALETGDYQTYLQKITGLNFNVSGNDLADIAKNGEYKDLDYKTEIKPLKDKINSIYNNLISDALSKGLDNIRPEDYEGLIDDSFDAGEEGPHRYEKFVRRYADLAGKSIEETNSLIIQAIEKDTQATTGAAVQAVQNLTWTSATSGFADLGDIEALANALGKPIDKILGSYNAAFNAYTFDVSGVDLSKVDDFSDTVQDSINEFIKSIFDNATKAITGKLSNTDVTTLRGQLDSIGLHNVQLDFTETVDGLKLSQRSAIELYNELKKIDSLQASLVFDELSKSLESSNENYQNISTILAHIADLQNKISELKPGDARLEMYKDELAVAQEIARVRSSTDNKDFNFMDRALPNGMQNPIDYWNATGEAYKAMNSAASSGYMEIQDFYNIVNEMSNMAQLSGQKLMFMGQEIDGSAEAAARLIEAGFNALINVKGDGVKIALANFGVDFETGAEAMKGNFDSGIKEMAKAQIQMLDAAIRMLEAMVAMENIDTNGDGTFGLDEIFVDGVKGPFKDNVNAWIQQLDTAAGGIEIGGKSLLEALQGLKPELVQSLLNDLANIDWESGLDAYEQITAVLSKYFSGEEIVQKGSSIFELLEMPPKADENLEEFNQWCEKAALSLEEGEKLYETLKKGETVDSSFVDNIANLLDLKERQREAFKTFVGEDGITQEEIQSWSQISFKEEGKITKPEYTATDGSTHALPPKPEKWSEYISKWETEIQNARISGGTNGEFNEEGTEYTFNITIGEHTVAAVTTGDTTTFTFSDGFNTEAKDINEALNKYANHLRRDNRADFRNKSNEEILTEFGYTYTISEENAQVEVDESLVKSVETAITNAFSGDGAAAIGTALATAISTALTGNQEKDIPVPTITLAPGNLVIDASSTTPQFKENKPLPIGNIDVSADNANLTSVGDIKLAEGTELDKDLGDIGDVEGTASSGEITAISGGWNYTKTDSEGNIKLQQSLGPVDATADQANVDVINDNFLPAEGEVVTLEYTDATGKVTSAITITPTNGYETNNVSGEVTYKGTHKAKTDGEMTITPKTYSLNITDAEGNTKTIEVPADVLLDSSNYSDFYKQIQELVKPQTKVIKLEYNDDDNPENKPTREEILNDPNYNWRYSYQNDITYKPPLQEQSSNVDNLEVENASLDLTRPEVTAKELPVSADQVTIQGLEPNNENNESDNSPTSTVKETPKKSTVQGLEPPTEDLSGITEISEALNVVNTAASNAAEPMNIIGNSNADSKLSDTSEALNNIANTTAGVILGKISSVINRIRDTSGAIRNVKDAIDSLANAAVNISVGVSVNVTGVDSKGTVNLSGSMHGGRTGSISGIGNSKTYKLATAKGQNQAMVTGSRKTLMGELGPELVVSNGHYFIVGQNGAEFVNLANDAIVFNHLQTQQLLSNGKASRGKAITNERAATSFATGNVEGPAMASAASALADLRRIRALWQSMLNASAKDLGSQAGGGSGGGGGGGGSGSAEWATVMEDYERWYNLLRQIAVVEQEINQLEAERKNIINGTEYSQNLQESLKNYAAQAKLTQELLGLQEKYYTKRVEDFNKSVAKLIYTYDQELDTLQYNAGGLDLLARLQETDVNNNYVNSATEQLKMIQRAMAEAGLDVAAEMKKITYDPENPGQQYALKQTEEGLWLSALDEKSGEAEKVNAEIVEKFYEVIDSYVEELDSLHDEIADRNKQLQELISKEMEIRQEYIENELKLEEKVLKAIEDREQKIIDDLEKSKETLQKANEKYIEGLSNALQREQDMYNKNKEDQELSKLQRQLSILQRTGGSASEIRNLQEQIDSQLQDQYFQKQQEQIDAIQEASDKQIEAMEEQIDIMKESLEYQKENGLLYAEVREIMAQNPEQITQFIIEHSQDWSSKSVLAKEEDLRELRKSVEMYFDSTEKGLDGMAWEVFKTLQKDNYSESTWNNVGAQAEEKFREVYTQTAGNVEEASKAANTILTAAQPSTPAPTTTPQAEAVDNRIDATTTAKATLRDRDSRKRIVSVPSGSNVKIAGYHEENGQITELWVAYGDKAGVIPANAVTFDETEVRKIAKYKKGGMITETGLAWVDGTSDQPEGILNAKQLKEFQTLSSQGFVDSIQKNFYRLMASVSELQQTNQVALDLGESDSGIINIENFDFSMNVESIANDYDARQAGRAAFDEMIKIARKTTNRALNRR